MSKKDKAQYIGKLYGSKSLGYQKIIDVEILQAQDYIYDGLALLHDDGYWHFGCPKSLIAECE